MDVGKIVELAKPILKEFEKFRKNRYDDGYGFITIGYGHVILPHEHFDDPITDERANGVLAGDINIALNALANNLKENVIAELGEEKLAALLCFVFNIGIGNFKASSMRSYLNALEFDMAVQEFPKWRRSAGRISRGLVRRRACEALFFDKGVVDFYPCSRYPQYVYGSV